MLASRFGVLIRNSKWNQHVRLFQPQRALPPDEPQFGPGQRRGGSRYVGLRGGEYPTLVVFDGPSDLSSSRAITDHGGWRREQRITCTTLEARAPGFGERVGIEDLGVSLPAGYQQVEQDRASALLVHQPELARQAAGQPRGDRQPDRGDNDNDSAPG